jgi:aconitate hydratase
MAHPDSFHARAELATASGGVMYYRLAALEEQGFADLSRMPFSIKILLEGLLRGEDGATITRDDILRLARYNPACPEPLEIAFRPSRVLLQDFTGVPCVVDLAAMRSAIARLGGNPRRINPRIPVDLVVDHSVQMDASGCTLALELNTAREFERNRERYEFFRWAQTAFDNFRVIPPSQGICHQVNLEYLACVVQRRMIGGQSVVFPDTLVGTDSHTTMINGLGIAGWGVGGIEAEAVMLGEPLYMIAPPVVGMRLTGRLRQGVTATDLVLTITRLLRSRGVVEKFVEFFGPGLDAMSVTDRATVANMAPEYGATMGFFPVDGQTVSYLRSTGRPDGLIDLVELYCKAQGLFRLPGMPEPVFQETLELDMSTVAPCLAGPSRPQDRIELSGMKNAWQDSLAAPKDKRGYGLDSHARAAQTTATLSDGSTAELTHGAVVIASITSCTNTSNPAVMLAAGLLAKKAVEAGLNAKPWVKTSLAPGSVVVTQYLKESGLLPYLEKLGFHVAGYGCATCIGNSGPLADGVEKAIRENKLVAACVVSGNRNFEGRVHPSVRAAFLASPPLVIAYALAGTIDIDLAHDPLGTGVDGAPVYFKDLWPADEEISRLLPHALNADTFKKIYAGIEQANSLWNSLSGATGELFAWQKTSTYIQEPPYFMDMVQAPHAIAPVEGARVLALLGHSITTDHISPAGAIAKTSPAAAYLTDHGVEPADFNSYGSRRGNHHVMVRGTLANIRLKNILAAGAEGSLTAFLPEGRIMSIFEASRRYIAAGTPTIIIAGRDYGMGSSRDWAAKGTQLLGVRAVIAESYERIHRSNLVGMGVLPLQFLPGETAENLGLTGRETYTVRTCEELQPGEKITVEALSDDGAVKRFAVLSRLDTPIEIDYYRHGGILPRVLRSFLKT